MAVCEDMTQLELPLNDIFLVRCVDGRGTNNKLVSGEIYTVLNTYLDGQYSNRRELYTIKGAKGPLPTNGGWYAWRFVKI